MVRGVKISMVVLLAAVAVVAAEPAATQSGSGLRGKVWIGPTQPVCRVGQPCEAPAHVTLLFSRTTTAGKKLQYASRSKATTGSYRVALNPGYYSVRTKEKIGITPNIRPHRVHVHAGRWDTINFHIDTGIR